MTRVTSNRVEGELETAETSLVRQEIQRRTSKVVKVPRTPGHHVSYSLVDEHKATITVGVIMGVFLLCWGPFFITNIISGLCKVSLTHPLVSDGKGTVTKLFSQENMKNKETFA